MNQILSQLVWVLPALLVGILGLVLAISRWSRHPQAALLVTLGISVLLVTNFIQMFTYPFILPKIIATIKPSSVAWIYGITNFTLSTLYQSGILLLILAAFADRKMPVPPPVR